jgi:hypothetical protein
MSRFNSAYFQNQILKNQIAADVSVANNTRINEDTLAVSNIDISGSPGSASYPFVSAQVYASAPTVTATNTYYINSTESNKLYKSDGSSWITTGLTGLNGVIFSSNSAATYAGKMYRTNDSAVLAAVTTGTFHVGAYDALNSTNYLFTVTNGTAVVKSAGRFLNLSTSPTYLYNIAYGVTDGTYTAVPNTPGARQFVDTTTDSYYYYNGTNWAAYA